MRLSVVAVVVASLFCAHAAARRYTVEWSCDTAESVGAPGTWHKVGALDVEVEEIQFDANDLPKWSADELALLRKATLYFVRLRGETPDDVVVVSTDVCTVFANSFGEKYGVLRSPASPTRAAGIQVLSSMGKATVTAQLCDRKTSLTTHRRRIAFAEVATVKVQQLPTPSARDVHISRTGNEKAAPKKVDKDGKEEEEPKSFWEKYRFHIILFFGMMIVQSLLAPAPEQGKDGAAPAAKKQ
jgi:hypothetical protein